MSDSADRIQAIRTRVNEIKDALNTFRRKSEGTVLGHKLVGISLKEVRVEKMIRYADEQAFAVLYQKVDGLVGELNKLETDIEDDIQEERDAALAAWRGDEEEE